jgi:hypothetical protein
MSDERIFDQRQRESLEASQHMCAYAGITKAQLAGLLAALGEYAIRVRPPEYAVLDLPGPAANDLELVETRRALVQFYWRRSDHGEDLSSDQPVFDPQERKDLSLHKYVRGCANLTKRDVLDLLDTLGRYSLNAPYIKPILGPPWTGLVRLIHAHNALVAFRDRPFSLGEFAESVHAVVRGENSQLTSPCSRSAPPAADEQR